MHLFSAATKTDKGIYLPASAQSVGGIRPLSLLDIDLIVYYEKLYGFSDYDVLTDLGL